MNVMVGTRQARLGGTEPHHEFSIMQGSGREINTDASCLNHSGGGGIDFRDKPVAIDGNSSKIHVACRGKSTPLKTGPTVLYIIRSLISCELVCYKKICKGSYVSGNLRDNKTS